MRPTLHIGSRGVDVVDWQGIIGAAQDGLFGPQTEELTRNWQSAQGVEPDGIVGPNTWTIAEGLEVNEMASIVHARGIERLTGAELQALIRAARWIKIDPDWLAAAISFETAGTFSPSKKNAAGSGAVGLIQFMPSTARNLGTTTDALAGMSFTQQLEYVKAYFAPMRGKLKSLEDVYLTIFYPKEVGRSPDDVIATEGDPLTQHIFAQNRGFANLTHGPTENGLDYITRRDVTTTITNVLKNAIANGPRITVPLLSTGAALATGAAAYGLYKLYDMRGKAT